MRWYAGLPTTRHRYGSVALPGAEYLSPQNRIGLRTAYRRLRRGGCDASSTRLALALAYLAGRQAGSL